MILKLLIVDDEKYIRDLIRLSIPWDSLGITVCGEAAYGEEALQLIEECHPHIVFTDICMEYMDGIELSQKIHAKYPDIKIIIISGHNKFDYAAKGMEAGVSAYLLKPFDEDRVTAVLENIKKEIMEEHESRLEKARLKLCIEENQSYLIESNLNQLLYSSKNAHNTLKRLSHLNVHFSEPFFQTAILQHEPAEDTSSYDSFLTEIEVKSLVDDSINTMEDVYAFYDIYHNLTILNTRSGISLLTLCNTLLEKILASIPCKLTIGIGTVASTLSQIRTSYEHALDAVRYKRILGDNQVIIYDNISITANDRDFQMSDHIPTLLEYIKTENSSKLAELIRFCVRSSIPQNSDLVPVRITVSTIINILMELLIQYDLREHECFQFCLSAYERLFRLETIDELTNMTINLSKSIIESFSEIRAQKSSSIIHSILDYITENYSDPNLSLTVVAEHFYLNPSYLSRLFKQTTNLNFSSYLTTLRLTNAAKLLVTTSLKSYEISEKVGFRDAKYFSICFKKYHGMTAKEYRIANQ